MSLEGIFDFMCQAYKIQSIASKSQSVWLSRLPKRDFPSKIHSRFIQNTTQQRMIEALTCCTVMFP